MDDDSSAKRGSSTGCVHFWWSLQGVFQICLNGHLSYSWLNSVLTNSINSCTRWAIDFVIAVLIDVRERTI